MSHRDPFTYTGNAWNTRWQPPAYLQHRGISARRRVRGGVRAIHESDAPPLHVGTPRRRVVERARRVYRLAHRERSALFSVQVCAHKRHNFPYLWLDEQRNLAAATFRRCIYLLFPLLLFNTAETGTRERAYIRSYGSKTVSHRGRHCGFASL